MSKLVPATIDVVLDAKRRGATDVDAALAGEIVPSTLYAWRRKGKADAENDVASPHRDFYLALCIAEAEHKRGLLAVVTRCADENDPMASVVTEEVTSVGGVLTKKRVKKYEPLKAATSLLKLRYPDEYGGQGSNVQINVGNQQIVANNGPDEARPVINITPVKPSREIAEHGSSTVKEFGLDGVMEGEVVEDA